MNTRQVQLSNDTDVLMPVCHELERMDMNPASRTHPYIGDNQCCCEMGPGGFVEAFQCWDIL